MKPCTIAILAPIGLLILAGCANRQDSAANPTIPPAKIDDAVFDRANRDYVFISGGYFRTPSESKQDVICSLDGRDWKPARKIVESSGLKYKAHLPYGPEYPTVWVRVYGIDGNYSDPVIVHN